MKKSLFLLSLVLSMVLGACNDALDIDQPGRLPADQAFQTVEDLRLGLLGVYGFMDHSAAVGFNAVYTDEASIGLDNGGQGINDGTYSFQLAPANILQGHGQIWFVNYSVINLANRVIGASEFVTVEEGEQASVNSILGQCYALRAYCHFVLDAYYSTSYTDDNALSVIKVDFVPTPLDFLPRNTNAEVYELIEADLNRADQLLTNDTSDPYFVNKDFVKALRARMFAYRERYQEAAVLAQQLLNDYPISNRTQFTNMFEDEDFTEVIFSINRVIGDNYDGQGFYSAGGGYLGSLFAFQGPDVEGAPYFELSRAIFNMLDEEDVRLERYVHPTSIIDPDYLNSPNPRQSDVLLINKYPGKNNQPLLADNKIFRSAEMLLILAEARVANGDLTGAASLIKQLRDARIAPNQITPIYNSQQEAFADILKERRLELALEAHRYLDLKRLGVRAGVGVERDVVDCAINNACTLPPTDFTFTLPIPQFEMDGNDNMVQNPGY